MAFILFSPALAYYISDDFIFDTGYVHLLIASSAIHVLYWIYLAKSYEAGDLSRVYPIMMSSPALVFVFAIVFIGEEISAAGASGILLISVGIYLISVKDISLTGLTNPLRELKSNQSVGYAFITLFTVAAYSIVDKMAMSHFHFFIYLYASDLLTYAFLTPHVVLRSGLETMKNELFSNSRQILANGFLVYASYGLILYVYTFEKVSYVVGLRQMSVVFGVIWGWLILGEKRIGVRLAAAGLITVGGYLISVAI